MKPKATVHTDIKIVLRLSNGLCPILSTTFPINIDDMVLATEKIANMNPVHTVLIPLSSRNVGRKGAAKPKFMLQRSRTTKRIDFYLPQLIEFLNSNTNAFESFQILSKLLSNIFKR